MKWIVCFNNFQKVYADIRKCLTKPHRASVDVFSEKEFEEKNSHTKRPIRQMSIYEHMLKCLKVKY